MKSWFFGQPRYAFHSQFQCIKRMLIKNDSEDKLYLTEVVELNDFDGRISATIVTT